MDNLFGDLLLIAVGVAASPLAVIAVILLLFGAHGRRNGVAFVLG
jgi:hypothetical protein